MEVLLISQFLGNYSYLLKTKLSNENSFVHTCKLELTITNLSIILFKVWNVIVNVKCEEEGWALLSGGGGVRVVRAPPCSVTEFIYCILWLWQPVHTAVSPFHSTDAVIPYSTQSQQQVGTMAYLCRIILLLLTIIVTRAGKEDFDKNV